MSEVFSDFHIQKRVEWLRTQGPADSWFGHSAAIIEQLQAEIKQWRAHAAERADELLLADARLADSQSKLDALTAENLQLRKRWSVDLGHEIAKGDALQYRLDAALEIANVALAVNVIPGSALHYDAIAQIKKALKP